MRLFFIRQPWMCCLALTLVLLFGVFLFADIREHPIKRQVDARLERRFPANRDETGKDALWLFDEALSLLKDPQLEYLLNVHKQSHGHREPYAQGFHEALRAYVEANSEALRLVREGVATGVFDANRFMWPRTRDEGPEPPLSSIHGTEYFIYGHPFGYLSRLRWSRTPTGLSSLETLIELSALDAILREDWETLMQMMELAWGMVSAIMNQHGMPEVMLDNLGAGFKAFSMLEIALNRMNIDNTELDRIRDQMEHLTGGRHQFIMMAYENYLHDGFKAFDIAREAAQTPYHWHVPRYGRQFFDYAFEPILEAWLSDLGFSQQYQLHQLMNALRIGEYYRYGGLDGMITPSPGYTGWRIYTSVRRSNIHDYQYFFAEEKDFNALSSEARQLEDEEQVLWPYFGYYEPYLSLLAYARVAECALAAAKYRNDTGRLPDTLDALVPRYLSAVPRDPHTYEQPLKYRRFSDRLVIYGVGANQTDDGGIPCPVKRQTSSTDIPVTLLDRAEDNQRYQRINESHNHHVSVKR